MGYAFGSCHESQRYLRLTMTLAHSLEQIDLTWDAEQNRHICIFIGHAWYCYMAQVHHNAYRKTSSISRTKSQSLNVSCILVQLSSQNPLKPDVKLRMKM